MKNIFSGNAHDRGAEGSAEDIDIKRPSRYTKLGHNKLCLDGIGAKARSGRAAVGVSLLERVQVKVSLVPKQLGCVPERDLHGIAVEPVCRVDVVGYDAVWGVHVLQKSLDDG